MQNPRYAHHLAVVSAALVAISIFTAGCGSSSSSGAGGATSASSRPLPAQWTESDYVAFYGVVRPGEPYRDLDVWHLETAELQRIAASVREMRDAPLPAFRAERRVLLMWTIETEQIGVAVCGDIPASIPFPQGEDEAGPYLAEWLLQLSASVIELGVGGGPIDPVEANARALESVAAYYYVAIQSGAPRAPGLDELVRLTQAGAVRSRIAEIATGCGSPGVVRF